MSKFFSFFIMLLVVFGLIFFLVRLGQKRLQQTRPPLTTSASLKDFQIYISVPKGLDKYAKQIRDIRGIFVVVNKGDNLKLFFPYDFSVHADQIIVQVKMPFDVGSKFDTIVVDFFNGELSLEAQKTSLENALSPTAKHASIYPFRKSLAGKCKTTNGNITLNIKVAEEAKKKIQKTSTYFVYISAADARHKALIGLSEIPVEKLQSSQVHLDIPISSSLTDPTIRPTDPIGIRFGACDTNQKEQCFGISGVNYEKMSDWLLIPDHLVPPNQFCPGGTYTYVLAPADIDMNDLIVKHGLAH